jgi:hypothetical protein
MSMRPDAAGSMPYTGMYDCLLKMVRNEGVLALWKGTGPTLARQVRLLDSLWSHLSAGGASKHALYNTTLVC